MNSIIESIQKAFQKDGGAFSYEAFHTQELWSAGVLAYKTKTRHLLKLSDLSVEAESYSFVIELKEHEILSVYPNYQELAEFGQLFNRPTACLHLRLDWSGKVIAILNQDDVNANWESLKQLDVIAQSLPFIEAGDKAFSNTLPILKEQWLYQLIFSGFSEESLLKQWQQTKYEISNHFKGKWIPVECRKKSLTNEQGITQINLLNQSYQAESFDKVIRDYYRQFSPAFLNDVQYYKYVSKTSYIFDRQYSHALKIISEIEEELNSSEVFISSYEVNAF